VDVVAVTFVPVRFAERSTDAAVGFSAKIKDLYVTLPAGVDVLG
jgi:hypothetical protein